MPSQLSVQSEAIVSHKSVTDWMKRNLHTAINVERRFTAEGLSKDSGVGLSAIRSYMRNDVQKEPGVANALSIAVVLGERAVQSLMALIGYTASLLDEPDTPNPMLIVARCMPKFGVIAEAAADGRIDHTEQPNTTDASDYIIAELLPLSSHRLQE